MIAYKGFNKELACTRGSSTFQYEIGKTYTEDKAKCANTGFHCVEEPIEVLRWYEDGRYCMVEASGDINEDGNNKISCTKMTILKEITLQELGILECDWLARHPERKYSNLIKKDEGVAAAGKIVIVRGENPRAKGEEGSTLYLLKEKNGEIVEIGVYEAEPGKWYGVSGCEKQN